MLWAVLVGGVMVALVGVLVGVLWRTRDVEQVAPPTQAPPMTKSAAKVSGAADVVELVRQGRTVEAIRAVRGLQRVGLKEAKDVVDHLRDDLAAGKRPTFNARPPPIIDVRDEDITREIRENRLLNAIALYREKTGVGLAEAKSVVEAMRDRMRAS